MFSRRYFQFPNTELHLLHRTEPVFRRRIDSEENRYHSSGSNRPHFELLSALIIFQIIP